MNWPAFEPSAAFEAPADFNPFVDPAGLGVRTIGSDAFSGELLEVLRVTSDLGAPAGIEPLVRARCRRFEPALLHGLAPVTRVERTFDGRLEVWSRRAEGFRLSAALEWTAARQTHPSIDAALTMGDRLLGALVSLQALDQSEGASGHGAIGIDQIVVSESGALTLTDYAFGTSLAALEWPRERLWRRFRIALPPAAGMTRFDHRVDVTQAAVVIASLLAGRVLRAEEYPRQLESIVAEAVRRSCADVVRDDRDRLSAWLRGATELETRNAFKTASAAREALRATLGHRVEDTAAIGRWLRAARGVTEPEAASGAAVQAPAAAHEPATGQNMEPQPAAPSDSAPATGNRAQAGAGRLRKWLPWS